MGSSIGQRRIIRFFYKNNCEKGAVHLGNTVITWCCVNDSDRGRLAAIRLWRPCVSQLKPTPHVYSEIRSNCGNRGRQEDDCERLSIALSSFRKDGFRGESRFGSFTRTAAGGWRGYTPHLLRAATATLLLGAGVDIIKVKELLGHRQVTTTQNYDKRRRNFKEWGPLTTCRSDGFPCPGRSSGSFPTKIRKVPRNWPRVIGPVLRASHRSFVKHSKSDIFPRSFQYLNPYRIPCASDFDDFDCVPPSLVSLPGTSVERDSARCRPR